jgi:TonB family protein
MGWRRLGNCAAFSSSASPRVCVRISATTPWAAPVGLHDAKCILAHTDQEDEQCILATSHHSETNGLLYEARGERIEAKAPMELDTSTRMREQAPLLACVLLALVSSCASEPETRGLSNTSRIQQGTSARAAVAGDDQAMDLQMSMGVLDQRAVERAMAPHVGAMVECFDRARDARRYLSGQVVLRFVVEASGSVSNIHVVRNELGNQRVERCLTSAGRRIVFPPPEGNRKTDFEYSMRF